MGTEIRWINGGGLTGEIQRRKVAESAEPAEGNVAEAEPVAEKPKRKGRNKYDETE